MFIAWSTCAAASYEVPFIPFYSSSTLFFCCYYRRHCCRRSFFLSAANNTKRKIEIKTTNKNEKSHEALVTWRPEVGGKFRGSLAFKMDGRFPAQVSVVGEAVDIGGGGSGGGGGGNRKKGDAREGRKRIKGAPVGAGVGAGKRRSLSQEATSRGAEPYTSVRGLCDFRWWETRGGSGLGVVWVPGRTGCICCQRNGKEGHIYFLRFLASSMLFVMAHSCFVGGVSPA